MKFVREEDYAGRRAVVAEHPEAVKIVRVEGGWAVFDTYEDYEMWRRQK